MRRTREAKQRWLVSSQAGAPTLSCSSLFILQGKSDLERHLVVVDFSIFDVTPGFHHLEPSEVPEGCVRASDGRLDCVLNAVRRGADEFNNLVDVVIVHSVLLWICE